MKEFLSIKEFSKINKITVIIVLQLSTSFANSIIEIVYSNKTLPRFSKEGTEVQAIVDGKIVEKNL